MHQTTPKARQFSAPRSTLVQPSRSRRRDPTAYSQRKAAFVPSCRRNIVLHVRWELISVQARTPLAWMLCTWKCLVREHYAENLFLCLPTHNDQTCKLSTWTCIRHHEPECCKSHRKNYTCMNLSHKTWKCGPATLCPWPQPLRNLTAGHLSQERSWPTTEKWVSAEPELFLISKIVFLA